MFDRIFIWTCDYCKKVVQKHDYGLPLEWVYIKTMGNVPHACEECKIKLSPEVKTGRGNE